MFNVNYHLGSVYATTMFKVYYFYVKTSTFITFKVQRPVRGIILIKAGYEGRRIESSPYYGSKEICIGIG